MTIFQMRFAPGAIFKAFPGYPGSSYCRAWLDGCGSNPSFRRADVDTVPQLIEIYALLPDILGIQLCCDAKHTYPVSR